MKYIYSVTNTEELKVYNNFIKINSDKIEKFLDYISKNFLVYEYPKYLVLCNLEVATRVHSGLPISAYTNERRIIFTPEIEVWKKIYINQLDIYNSTEQTKIIESYYDRMSDNNLLQIIGHELVHHSELFVDDFNDELESGIWFEEGMCEYISKKFFLSDQEYKLEKQINQSLVEMFEEKNTWKSLESFGYETFDNSYAAIFYNYCRSFLAIEKLVNQYGGIEKVFEKYKEWDFSGRQKTLVEWFNIEKRI